MIRALGFAAVVAILACQSASAQPFPARRSTTDKYPPVSVTFPNGVTGLPNVSYWLPGPGFHAQTLDLYLPAQAPPGPRPVILFVHGGSWNAGHSKAAASLEDLPAALAQIAGQGYVTVSINYRLSGEAPFPAAIQDLKAAIRFLKAGAAEYNIDPGKIGLWGTSAGGQLVGLAGTSCGQSYGVTPAQLGPKLAAQTDCPASVVAWYGVFDMTGAVPVGGGVQPAQPNPAAPASRYLGCVASACPDQAKSASAVTYIDARDPEVLLLHGDADRVVSVEQSRVFDRALKAAGVKSTLVVLPGVDHSMVGPTPAVTQDAINKSMAATLGFFDRTLRGR